MVRCRVQTLDYAADGATIANTVNYLYDGLLVLEELDGSGQVSRHITRGLDLSSTMQGGGGIGGILANTAYFCYDGNGNVVNLIDGADQIVADYRYDPFGNRVDDPTDDIDNPYQWSTKETHTTTGLVYYLYRYYSPELGRWINRDPIEENGGVNIYAALFNDPPNKLDYFGLNAFLQARVNRIEAYLLAVEKDGASQEAYFLYINLTTGGQFFSPFANEMMEHWLANTEKKKTLKASRVKKLVKDVEISKQLGASMASLSGSGTTIHATSVTPTLNTDNFYALGTFTLSFDGRYCVKGDKIDLDGKWNVKDRYDWHAGLDVTVQGVVIKDDYALLVEQAGRAKPYDVDGEWKAKHTVSKSASGGSGER